MTSLRANWIRFLSLFRKAQLDRDLDDELAAHLDLHIADNLRAGMSPAEARRQALLKLGGLQQTKESYRDTRGFATLESIYRDFHFAIRILLKNSGFTGVAVLTLALGIGATTSIFTVVNAVLLRSLPFPRSSELVDISGRSPSFDIPFLSLSLPDVSDVRAGSSSFVSLAVYQDSPMELSSGGTPERIESTQVSEDFFTTLGVVPLIGRNFTTGDLKDDSRLAILSFSLWRERFGSDPHVLEKTINLDGQPFLIVGVMPALPTLGFATDSEIWTMFVPTAEQRAARDAYSVSVVARLKPGLKPQDARNEIDALSSRLSTAYPEAHPNWSLQVTPLTQFLLGDARTPLAILFCAVSLVLLIACGNVSSLLLARNIARTREFAIRLAVGASRGAILRQLAMECLMLSFLGGTLALLIGPWTLRGLRSVLPPEVPRVGEIRIDGYALSFALAASVAAALISGLIPAVLTTRQNPNAAIKSGVSSTFAGRLKSGSHLFRPSMVVAEVALSVILLLGAVLTLRSFDQLLRVNLGFQPDHLLTLRTDFPKFRFANASQSIAFVRQVLDGLRATPGVISASAGLVYPMSDEIAATLFQTETTSADPSLGEQSASSNRVTPEFFRTFEIPFLAGHDFTDTDASNQSPVFIVNKTLARKYFGTIDADGKRLSARKENGQPVWGHIIGVVGDVRGAGPRDEPKPEVYAAFYQTRVATGVYFTIRTRLEPRSMIAAAENRIWAVDKYQPITHVATLSERISEVNAAPKSQALLLGVFAFLGVMLALIGLYGVISYLVSLQTHEIGIRMALGAAPFRILRSVLARGLLLTLIGIAIGIAGGLVLTRFLSGVLFGISPTDPLTFAGVPSLLAFAALLACFLPARRATKVDPMTALRYE